jgi:uncharacterized tellurite resistance protein B-like protein
MTLFDKLSPAEPCVDFIPATEQEAWIYVMYGCIAADGNVSEAETDKLCQLVVSKTFFEDHDVVPYYQNAMYVHEQTGSKELICNAAERITIKSRPTLFALVMDLLLADGILGEKEQEIAEYLATAIQLDKETAEKIVEVMLIRNKGNKVFSE